MNANHERPPPQALFFAPLQIALTPNDFERVQFAYVVSKYGHAKQVRDDGSRYFDHPKGAAWIYIQELNGRDPRIICDLLLHDLDEDQYLLSPYRIAMNFGHDIALDTGAVTKLPKGKESTTQYLKRVELQGPWSILTKLIDRLHNLRDQSSPEKHQRQIDETKKYHLPLLIPALKKYGEPWESLANRVEEMLYQTMGDDF